MAAALTCVANWHETAPVIDAPFEMPATYTRSASPHALVVVQEIRSRMNCTSSVPGMGGIVHIEGVPNVCGVTTT
jgi:hypothetical protein